MSLLEPTTLLPPGPSSGNHLPPCYQRTQVHDWEYWIDPDVELTRQISVWERLLGYRPTVRFTRVRGFPGRTVLGNPYPRRVLLGALGIEDADWPRRAALRLHRESPGLVAAQGNWDSRGDVTSIPAIRHRPGDAGPYITAGVGVTRSFSSGRVNLGFYRVQLINATTGLIFFDPRTDAFHNLQQHVSAGVSLPIAIFLGANPIYSLVGAAALPAAGNDFGVAAKLLGTAVELVGDPPVPADAGYVIRGRVSSAQDTEGPFAEFKGYYVPARQSNVIEIDEVLYNEEAAFPTIVTGAESGLTLMSMQNELLMFDHLQSLGFSITSVRYPLAARAEFLGLIEAVDPSQDLLEAAMQFNSRCKVTMVGRAITNPWDVLGTYRVETTVSDYLRKGQHYGSRLGLLVAERPEGREVEF